MSDNGYRGIWLFELVLQSGRRERIVVRAAGDPDNVEPATRRVNIRFR